MRAARLWIVTRIAKLCGVPIKVRDRWFRPLPDDLTVGDCSKDSS